MKTILMTGTTGFLGSYLAARLLKEGVRIIAVNRRDPDGKRCKAAIVEAATHCHINLSFLDKKLVAKQVDPEHLLDSLQSISELSEVDECWHCAAEMSYNPLRLEKSIQTNLENTLSLYEHLAATTNSQRFYHFSTAYTLSMKDDKALEELHYKPHLINIYQLTKWSAEMSLAHAVNRWNLPITILRPTVIVGDQFSGWHGRSRFGFYAFINMVNLASQLNIQRIELDLKPEVELNLIPVDTIADYCIDLLNRSPEGRGKFEIFHLSAASSLNIQEIFEIANKVSRLKLEFSQDHHHDDHLDIYPGAKENLPFVKNSVSFDQSKLMKALHRQRLDGFRMNAGILERLIRGFINEDVSRKQRSRLA